MARLYRRQGATNIDDVNCGTENLVFLTVFSYNNPDEEATAKNK